MNAEDWIDDLPENDLGYRVEIKKYGLLDKISEFFGVDLGRGELILTTYAGVGDEPNSIGDNIYKISARCVKGSLANRVEKWDTNYSRELLKFMSEVKTAVMERAWNTAYSKPEKSVTLQC